MKNRKYKNGFSLVELLIALAITAMLMVAMAFAFSSSMMSYRTNEELFKAVNSARQAMYRITTELRTATTVDPNGPANECTFITAGGQNITYEYRDTDSKLYLITNSNGQEYVLCDNVSAMNFIKETDIDPEDGLIFVKSVQISMTVQVGHAERKVSAAAVIRRNLN
jgi:prepilin-type N-terminal cleavage/methylation domain-containing protein